MATEAPQVNRPLALHVSNLAGAVSEHDLYNFFQDIDVQVTSLRIIRDEKTSHARYAYINFVNAESADKALLSLNFKVFQGKELSLARSIPPALRIAAANLYVSPLPPNCRSEQLYNAFSMFGDIISARVPVDPATQQPRPYGYVHFVTLEAANKAIAATSAGPLALAGNSVSLTAQEFIPQAQRPRPEPSNVFIRNFPVSRGEEAFSNFVSQFGTVTSYSYKGLVSNLAGDGQSATTFGFANYVDSITANNAIAKMTQEVIEGFRIEAFPALSRTSRDQQLAERARATRNPHANLYIRFTNINDENVLRQSLDQFGPVVSVKVLRTDAGVLTGQAYAQYEKPEDAQAAIQGLGSNGWHAAVFVPKEQRAAARPYDPSVPAIPYNYRQYPMYPFYPPPFSHQMMWVGYPQGGRPAKKQRSAPFNKNNRHQPRQQANVPVEQAAVASAELGAAPAAENRQVLGEQLYYKVHAIDADQAPKITGMLLEMQIAEVENLLHNPEELAAKIKEAQGILTQQQ